MYVIGKVYRDDIMSYGHTFRYRETGNYFNFSNLYQIIIENKNYKIQYLRVKLVYFLRVYMSENLNKMYSKIESVLGIFILLEYKICGCNSYVMRHGLRTNRSTPLLKCNELIYKHINIGGKSILYNAIIIHILRF